MTLLNRERFLSLLLLVVGAIFAGGCDADQNGAAATVDGGPGGGAPDVSQSPDAPAGAPQWVSGQVPAMAVGEACPEGDEPAEIEFCDWLTAADLVFYGTLIDVSFRDDLFVEPGDLLGSWRPSQCLEGIRLPALVLRIAVEGALWGAAPEEVEVSIGYRRIELFAPRPAQDAGGVVWLPSRAGGGPLEVGQTLGVAAYHLGEYETWSILGESLFTFSGNSSETATSVFQANPEGCGNDFPAGAAGLTMGELAANAASCGATRSTAAEQRRTRMLESWGPHADGQGNPAYFVAGECLTGDDTPEPGTECTTDEDC